MNINKIINAYVTDGGCWHEWKDTYDTNGHTVSTAPTLRCKHCGTAKFMSDNPDYSTPDNFKVLLDKLFGDIPMYRKFEGWLFHEKYKQDHVDTIGLVDTRLFVPWLFSDWKRFCALFAEFLRLPETVKEFGWEECSCKGEPIQGDMLIWCFKCDGTGKIKKPWAKEVKDV